jgi:hypothetical protein
VRVLHLAATTSERQVESALALLLDAGTLPTFDAVRELVGTPRSVRVPQLSAPVLDLSSYDRLLPSQDATVAGRAEAPQLVAPSGAVPVTAVEVSQ